jgi:hypothetical protein
MQKLPKLEIVANMGVGYDPVDAKWAGEHGIVVTNTPGVLDDEVADTTIALLLNTLRQLPQSERYLRAGKWLENPSRSPSRPCATAPSALSAWGASARRSQTHRNFRAPIVYHSRRPVADVSYRHYPDLSPWRATSTP